MSWTVDEGLKAVKRMQERTSCRSFSDKPIPAEILDEILAAGLQAASGGNLQPVSVVMITDLEKRQRITELCGNQKFIGEAPVNLVFFVDWYKMQVFAKHEKAPFTCDDSYMHFLIAAEDVMCMAQIIETAAHLCGLGSCYVGSTNSHGDEIAQVCNMPKGTYPIVMLSLGYPKTELNTVREKLEKDIMIFENACPDMTDEFIIEKFRNKYGDRAMPLPKDEEIRKERLDAFRVALTTTYSEEEADEIIEKAKADGKINETQRRFGLHYHARWMRESGKQIIATMEEMGLTSFNRKEDI